jgi:hypothetical protein
MSSEEIANRLPEDYIPKKGKKIYVNEFKNIYYVE